MDIRPQDLPDVRDQVLHERLALGTETIASLRGNPRVARAFGITAYEMVEMETAKVACADLFFISTPMTELACAAAQSLPRFASDAHDFPSKAGFAYFNGGFEVHWDTYPVRVHAVSWMLVDWGAAFAFYIDKQSAQRIAEGRPGSLIAQTSRGYGLWCNDIVRSALSFNTGLSDEEAEEATNGAEMATVSNPGMHVLRSALLLMQQPLAENAEVTPDRAARKRAQRANYEPKPVRVIELRRPKHTNAEPGESGREYHHRWITRGHWRQQWYPARQVHRPVWIAPHMKGPEGAPLIGGEKVYALKR